MSDSILVADRRRCRHSVTAVVLSPEVLDRPAGETERTRVAVLSEINMSRLQFLVGI